MGEDNLYLFFSYLILGATFFLFVLRSKKKLKTATIHLLIAGCYSSFFIYELTFNSSGGSGLVWLLFLMLFIGLHWLILVIGIILSLASPAMFDSPRSEHQYPPKHKA